MDYTVAKEDLNYDLNLYLEEIKNKRNARVLTENLISAMIIAV
jgi:hypothetical protein